MEKLRKIQQTNGGEIRLNIQKERIYMAIFIPKKLNVGFQGRAGTYSGKLAYVIYYDQTGKLRKETSWQNWRDKNIPNEEYDNEPMDGFVINKKVGGVEESWGHFDARKTYVRVYDPRGFEFEITIPNLIWILENCDCIKGKGLDGKFVYGWNGTELLLVPVDSPDYKEIEEKNKVIHNNTFIKTKELIVGATYEDLNGKKYVYMGKFKPWGIEHNHYRHGYCKAPEYEFPLDTTWKKSIFDDCSNYEHPWYHRYKQRKKEEFFFVVLGASDFNYVEHMKSANKKFTKMISETTERYFEYVDLLNSNTSFSPIDYDTEKILSLPYKNFEAGVVSLMGNISQNRAISFGMEQNGYIRKVTYYYDYEKSQFYRDCQVKETYETKNFYGDKVTRENTVWRKKYYNSIKEMYAETNPVYGIQYLANGKEHERKYYYGTDGSEK